MPTPQNIFRRFFNNENKDAPIILQGHIPYVYKYLVRKEELVDLMDQLATLLVSNIAILDSLIIIKQQCHSKILKRIFALIAEDVKRGLLLSQAMERQGHIFPEKWISLIQTGEYSGQLAEILVDLSSEEKKHIRLHAALKSAMAYPLFILTLTLGLLLYMLLVVVPEIQDMYEKMHQSLPSITLLVINLSEWVKEFFASIIIVFFASIFTIKLLSQLIFPLKKGLDFVSFYIPILGDLRKKQNIALFSGNLAMLLKSGILVTDALLIIQKVLPSVLYQKEVERIFTQVNSGKRISQEMGLINLQKEEFLYNFYFPLQVAQMVHIGEETENLVPMLEKIKEDYMNKIDTTLKTFSSLLEPVMILFVGLAVGGILLAVMLPFFSLKV
jgi:type IV pilus assembly protein PilC